MLNEKWRKRFARSFKLRFAILYPLGTWAVISAYPTDKSIRQSTWLILSGLAIRTWANCYAIKTEKLTTCGPYAYVRHPLYLGSFLILTGFMIMLNVNWLVVLLSLSLLIGIVYKTTVGNEEKMLLDKFGGTYLKYQKSVPAFLPAIFPFKGGKKWRGSIRRYFRSKEYKLFIWTAVLIIVFHLKEEYLIEGERFGVKSIFLIALALLLGLTDAAAEIFLKKRLKGAR